MTATSSARALARALLAAALAAFLMATGCGAGQGGSQADTPFAWLRPAAPPPGWSVARIPQGAALAYPTGWRAIPGDRGSTSAALRQNGRLVGYLNLTPRQGAERQAGWTAFRLAHNRAEGFRAVRLLGAAAGLRFRHGTGACVRDSYATSTGARYVEIACLVSGVHGSSVIVAAAPPAQWPAQAATLERALSALSA